MMEGETETTEHGETLLEKVIFQLGESEPGLYREMHEALKDGPYMQDVKGILAPAGEKIYSVRIRGIGRIMLVLRDDEDEVTLVNERTGEKETGTWEDIEQAWNDSGKKLGKILRSAIPGSCTGATGKEGRESQPGTRKVTETATGREF
jgi:hypothetical protein